MTTESTAENNATLWAVHSSSVKGIMHGR